jgi:hypothetical protein
MRTLTISDQGVRPFVNPLTHGPAGLIHGGWAEDPAWSNPGDGGLVTSWRNASGGGDPAQGTVGNQPTWRKSVSIFSGRSAVQFNGTSTFLTFNVADVSTPTYFVCIYQGTGVGVASQYAMGIGSPNFAGLGQDGGGKQLMFYPGAGTPPKSLANRDALPHLGAGGFRLGAAGWVKLDNEAKQTGNTGSSTNFTELVIGAGFNGVAAATWLNGFIHFWAVYSADPTVDSKWPVIVETARRCGVAV